MLDVLEAEGVPATFFVVGRNVAGREALLTRMLAERPHDRQPLLHPREPRQGRSRCADADRRHAGGDRVGDRLHPVPAPPTVRPRQPPVAAGPVGAGGSRASLWSVNPQDFRTPGTATIKRRVLAGVKPGAIILDHDGGGDRRQTLAAIPSIIRTLKARGYRFVTVTDLLGLGVQR